VSATSRCGERKPGLARSLRVFRPSEGSVLLARTLLARLSDEMQGGQAGTQPSSNGLNPSAPSSHAAAELGGGRGSGTACLRSGCRWLHPLLAATAPGLWGAVGEGWVLGRLSSVRLPPLQTEEGALQAQPGRSCSELQGSGLTRILSLSPCKLRKRTYAKWSVWGRSLML